MHAEGTDAPRRIHAAQPVLRWRCSGGSARALMMRPPATVRCSRRRIARDFLRARSALVSVDVRDLHRVGNAAASARRMSRTSIPPSPVNAARRARVDDSRHVGGTSSRASQMCAKRNHSRGSAAAARASSRDARNAACRPGCRRSRVRPRAARAPPRKIARLGPVRQFQAHEDAARLRKIAEPRERVDLPLAVRVGQLRDDVMRAEFRGRVELRNEILGLERRVHPEELGVMHRDAGVGEPRLRRLHQRAVARKVVEHLVGRHACHAQAHVS